MPEPTLEVVSYMSNHYEIKIHLVGGISVKRTSRQSCTSAIPSAILQEGMARIVFPSGSPYAVSKVHDTHNHTVKTPGNFQYECFVTPTGKTKEIGYNPNDPQVRRRARSCPLIAP